MASHRWLRSTRALSSMSAIVRASASVRMMARPLRRPAFAAPSRKPSSCVVSAQARTSASDVSALSSSPFRARRHDANSRARSTSRRSSSELVPCPVASTSPGGILRTAICTSMRSMMGPPMRLR